MGGAAPTARVLLKASARIEGVPVIGLEVALRC